MQQLEDEIKGLNHKPIDSNIERLESEVVKKDNEIKKLEVEKNQNIQKIKQLEISVSKKELQLETSVKDSKNSIQELEHRIASLTENLRDVEWELSKCNVGDNSGLIEELRKQIAQKNDVIIKWEFEDNKNKKELSSIKEEKNILQSLIYQLEIEKSNLCQQLDELQKQIAQKEDGLIIKYEYEKNNLEAYVKEIEEQLNSIASEKTGLQLTVNNLENENSNLREELSKAKNSNNNNNNNNQNIDENELQKLQRLIAQKNDIIRQLETQLDEFLEYAYIIKKYHYLVESTGYHYSYSDIEDIDIQYITTWAEDDFLYFAREFFTFLESYVY